MEKSYITRKLYQIRDRNGQVYRGLTFGRCESKWTIKVVLYYKQKEPLIDVLLRQRLEKKHISVKGRNVLMTKIRKETSADNAQCLMVDDRYLIYLDDGVIYDTEDAKPIPQYVFKIRDFAHFIQNKSDEEIKFDEISDYSEKPDMKELNEIIGVYDDIAKIDNMAKLISSWLKLLKKYIAADKKE